MDALLQLGMVSELLPSEAQNTETSASEAKDYFVSRDGVKFAGTHLIIDLWDATNLGDPEHIDQVLREAAIATGATILHGHFHHFGPGSGVSGVLVLAESHVSIHTWPERDYAALDIFVCGACNPYLAIPVLKKGFQPGNIQLSEHKRGLIG
ncbi:S-adenosylmethionine decarboxylase proenzyme [Siccirubricoccus deserti]|uniref:S-adenosylmethionine decarboxylase proenzyme n=1 Tax=Siccirubricoccus deserti TaxID=2013562 RepID=A0A9X0R4M6_9PROT|nr:adenosylmethionine decarboxylase [Siccirubricoccus deserti]MBC4018302.1 adenosylmethionine decarboxylase [Siccirubricoccus deserti]GGC64167.1 S-adenosylmethionine decarboxylase proenzyme [Siccirubricoccus deserti]